MLIVSAKCELLWIRGVCFGICMLMRVRPISKMIFANFADFVHISEAIFKKREAEGLVLLFAVVVKIKNLWFKLQILNFWP